VPPALEGKNCQYPTVDDRIAAYWLVRSMTGRSRPNRDDAVITSDSAYSKLLS
jgi:hypothetical protein